MSNESIVQQARTLYSEGDPLAALQILESVDMADEGGVDAWLLRGHVLANLNRHDEAVHVLQRVLDHCPGMTDARAALAHACIHTGEYERAIALLRDVVARVPGHSATTDLAILLRDKADALAAEERDAEALTLLQEAVALNYTLPGLLASLGMVLVRLGNYAASEGVLRLSLQLYPDQPLVMTNLATALDSLNQAPEAEHLCRRVAEELMPELAPAWCNLGAALRSQGKLSEARIALERALQIDFDLVPALANLGTLHSIEGRFEESRRLYRRALALAPSQPLVQFLAACDRLKAGDWEDGWTRYECRGRYSPQICWDDIADWPVWPGGDPKGQRILLATEQGFGDSLQFFRYASFLADRGAHVGLLAPVALERLFRLSDPRLHVMPAGTSPPIADWDFGVSLLSLPHRFGTRVDTVPAVTPYLHADKVETAVWADHLSSLSGLKVGLVWAGDARPHDPAASGIDSRRSMDLSQLAPLAAIPGLRFISLQKGPRAAQALDGPFHMHDWTDDLNDFADTAALVSQLDLVVAVDTAVAHLAGGMGRPVLLLSRYDGCWRWLSDRDDTPWYPNMRLYRQKCWGDWSEPIRDLCMSLAAYVRT